MALGGKRPGSGRKKRVDEEWSRKICIKSVEKLYGSVEAGIEHVLNGKDEKIKLFIWQHIMGVPETITKVKHSDNQGNKLEGGIINEKGIVTIEVVRTVHNKDVIVGGD
jgi:hypothetical protein